MRYVKVKWIHEHQDEPVLLYSEMDSAGREVRKVEVFRDGSVGIAGGSQSTRGTWLGSAPVPPLAEIASNPEFEPAEIEKDEFEEIWRRALG